MKSVTLSELQSHVEECFDAVEGGEEIEVRRNGVPLAIVSPPALASPPVVTGSRWKRARPVELEDGVSLSRAILAERDSTP